MNYLWLKINKKYKNRLLIKCYKKKITVYDTKEDNSFIYLKISSEDYKTFQKSIIFKYQVIGGCGPNKIKSILKKYHIFFFSLIVVFIIFFFLTHIMTKVIVIHSNKEIRELVTKSLKEKGIKENSFKKSYQEIQKIKEEILNLYPTKLEWLEIEVKGMNYIVRVEERKIKEEEVEKDRCNIIATKDAIIKKIIYSKGEAIVEANDYVKKGDILISGVLKKDEEEKGVVCASGKVLGEVWYKITLNIPKVKEITEPTGKKRWNLKLSNNTYNDLIFKSRLDNYQTEEHHLFTLFGSTLSFVVQKEITKKTVTLSNEELKQIAEDEIKDKLNIKDDEDKEIIDKKILTEEINDDNLTMEFFVVVLEKISQSIEF